MTLICYVERNFRAKTSAIIEQANKIVGEYVNQGYVLTLRQLFYQFVSRELGENTKRAYDNLLNVIRDARRAGLISWDAIEDRTRNLVTWPTWESPRELLESAAEQFARDKWKTQQYRPEVWIEKEALTGVIHDVCEELQVPYFAARGYNSDSEQWRAALRAHDHGIKGHTAHIFYLGDHDPSGLDMPRDLQDRFEMFGAELIVDRLALNLDQVSQYSLPPNFAKTTDKRSAAYIAEFGNESWELDALEPGVIVELIRNAVLNIRDDDAWQEAIDREQEERSTLHDIIRGLPE